MSRSPNVAAGSPPEGYILPNSDLWSPFFSFSFVPDLAKTSSNVFGALMWVNTSRRSFVAPSIKSEESRRKLSLSVDGAEHADDVPEEAMHVHNLEIIGRSTGNLTKRHQTALIRGRLQSTVTCTVLLFQNAFDYAQSTHFSRSVSHMRFSQYFAPTRPAHITVCPKMGSHFSKFPISDLRTTHILYYNINTAETIERVLRCSVLSKNWIPWS